MSFSQIELVHVRVECECFWVNLREDNKVSESKMAVSESKMAEFKMAAIIKFSENAWVKYFLRKMVESKMAEFKMAAIIKFSQNEWVWVLNAIESELRVEWEFPLCNLSRRKQVWVKCFCAEFEMAEPIIKYESESMSEDF